MDSNVMVFGAFDLFHPGHRFFLNKSRALGKTLHIIIGRDKNVCRFKKKNSFWHENKRLEILKTYFKDDKNVYVFLGHISDFLYHIKKFKPDIIAMGYDQKLPAKFPPDIKKKLTFIQIEAHYPEKYKTSKMNTES